MSKACLGTKHWEVSLQTDHLIGTSANSPQCLMVTHTEMGTVGLDPHGLFRRHFCEVMDFSPGATKDPNMEWLMHIKSVDAQSPHVGTVQKFGEWDAILDKALLTYT
ncbi:hypothetical protein TNCV_2256771 [Trichonephila clavipes]|nr:hypothetical protein TNCV_2256771 [Trichonephila clavipes]